MIIKAKPGDRICLIEMLNDPQPIKPGEQGTVLKIISIDFETQIWVKWDSGRILAVLHPTDKFEILRAEPERKVA